MTKYPNRDALRQANDIYLDCMRPFVIHHLKQVPGEKVEDLIGEALTNEQIDQFWGKLDEDDDIESAIDFSYFPLIIKNNWSIIRNERNYGFAQQFNKDIDIQNMLWLIKKGRNYCEHRGTKDLDSELVRVNLFFLADVLGKINRPDQQRKVEIIRDELVSDKTDDTTGRSEKLEEEKAELAKRLEEVEAERIASEEHLTDKSNLLESTEAENVELKKRLSGRENRLKTVESESNERIKTLSEQLIDNTTKLEAKEETLSTLSDQLRTVEAEKAELEECLKNSPKQLETLTTEYEERLQTALKQLKTANAVKTEVEERLETTSTRLENVESELTACQEHLARTLRQLERAKSEQAEYLSTEERLARALTELEIEEAEEADYEEDLAEIDGHLLRNAGTPDSVTFQDTTFTMYLNKYRVAADDITQTFWSYWQAQGHDGKQEMWDAGWSVKKVDGDWEVTISPEDFEAWIEDEVTELSSLLNFSRDEKPSTQPIRPSHEKTALPTGKEMEQPALEFLSDGREHRRVEIIDRLTEHFSLTDDERKYLSRTGQAEKHLVKKRLIERTRTGYYRITAHGLEVVDDVSF